MDARAPPWGIGALLWCSAAVSGPWRTNAATKSVGEQELIGKDGTWSGANARAGRKPLTALGCQALSPCQHQPQQVLG